MKALNNLKESLFYIADHNGLYRIEIVHFHVRAWVPFIAVMSRTYAAAAAAAAATYNIVFI
jgi:hypothetical protein